MNHRRVQRASKELQSRDVVTLFFPESPISKGPQKIQILYEDSHFVIVNKPIGILSVPSPDPAKTNMIERLSQQLGRTVGPAHRLDRDTSGVLMFGKSRRDTEILIQLFRSRRIRKKYWGLVHWNPQSRMAMQGRWRSSLSVVKRDSPQLWGSVPRGGKPSETFYAIRKKLGATAVVEFEPLTGRTHQIRVHASEAGIPIVGDPLYGNPTKDKQVNATRLMLHAEQIEFRHPFFDEDLRVVCPPPELTTIPST